MDTVYRCQFIALIPALQMLLGSLVSPSLADMNGLFIVAKKTNWAAMQWTFPSRDQISVRSEVINEMNI